MAVYLPDGVVNVHISIESTKQVTNFTKYVIKVMMGEWWWQVSRRYREFHELHSKLVTAYGIPKDLLPPKKLIGYQEPDFINKRKRQLEKYLRELVALMAKCLPPQLMDFLEFSKYEVMARLRQVAVYLSASAGTLLTWEVPARLSPLELYAIRERLRTPCPSPGTQKQNEDFSFVLDYASQVTSLLVMGSDVAIGESNLVLNKLPIDFGAFKHVTELQLENLCLRNVQSFGNVKETTTQLTVIKCKAESLKDILLCDHLHKDVSDASEAWGKVVNGVFCNNGLTEVDESVNLLIRAESLDLSQNRITEFPDLSALSHLMTVQLSFNRIHILGDLHQKLGKVVMLNLSSNSIDSLRAFRRLYCLENLDLTYNQLKNVEEIEHIALLPCLEKLNLVGNPLTLTVDYRAKVLERFDKRAKELCLDNEVPSQKELDTVAVLQALKAAKQLKLS